MHHAPLTALTALHSNKQENNLFSKQRGQEVMGLNWSRE